MSFNYNEELDFGDLTDESLDSEIEASAIVKHIEPFVSPVSIPDSINIEKHTDSIVLVNEIDSADITVFKDRLTKLHSNGFRESKFPPSDDRYMQPIQQYY
jgi:hypothetical protein